MNRSLRTRMIVLIVGPTLAIFVVGLALAMDRLCDNANAELEVQMTHLAENYAARFDGVFRELATIADVTARFMETHPDVSESEIYAQLRANVLQNDAVYGAAMAFEPGTFKKDQSLFCPYVYRGDNGIQEMNIGRDEFDWYGDKKWQWWHLPKTTRRSGWTDPYSDEGAGNVLMVTYSVPFFRDGAMLGVTTVDVKLATLNATIGDAIREDLKFIILSQQGQYLYHFNKDWIMNQNVFELARELKRPEVEAAARELVSGQSGVILMPTLDTKDPVKTCVFYAPIRSTGWGFAALLPESEVLAGVRAQMKVAGIAMATTLLIIVGLVLYVSGRITRPIGQLRDKVLSIAGGNLDARVEGIASRDEIGELARSFNTMAENLGTIVGQVRQSSIRLHSTVTELNATSREQEATTASFGASANEIAASARQISATGGDLARTVHQVHEVAGGTSALASDGQAGLRNMESTMRELDAATTSIGEKLATINTEASAITGVVKTINKVADQTNLLSVNAAIEAEKAGDYGVGFLVVAREVRRLSDLTASATLDIRTMVQSMQSAVSTGVMEMDRFADQVRRSVKDVAAMAHQMGEIIARVNENTASFEQINEGMQQQSQGAEQISTAMRELTDNANRTAEATHDYVQVANDLHEAIHVLKSSIASFDLK